MTLMLNLPPHIEQAYLAEAQLRGVPLDTVVLEVLAKAQPVGSEDVELQPEEWVRKFQAWSQRHAHDDLPILSDEAISRESI